MSSYKPPFARRLGRRANNKPVTRTAKNPATNTHDPYADSGTKTAAPVNVDDALADLGLVDDVVEVTASAEEVVASVVVDDVVEVTVEAWTMKNKKAELLEAAESLGLSVDDSMNKASILEAINGAG